MQQEVLSLTHKSESTCWTGFFFPQCLKDRAESEQSQEGLFVGGVAVIKECNGTKNRQQGPVCHPTMHL